MKKLEYGIAAKAWHPLIGCDPHMSCAPRCWAVKAAGRVVECQTPRPEKGYAGKPERVEFFRQALTPDLKQWSGSVLIDEAHLNDPLRWRTPALIACGFHGDWARLPKRAIGDLVDVMVVARRHRFLTLTKMPSELLKFVGDGRSNMSIGCSVMNQAEADRQRPAMAALAAMGWHTHCWYEPAVGPVDWKGWEFLELLVAGGESGKDSRPMNPTWPRDARDWCAAHGIAYRLKQWGDWCRWDQLPDESARIIDAAGDGGYEGLRRVGKRLAGNLLDGQAHNGLPDWMRV